MAAVPEIWNRRLEDQTGKDKCDVCPKKLDFGSKVYRDGDFIVHWNCRPIPALGG
jgi:hypothetical protein